MQLLSLALGFLSVVSASAVEKRQGGSLGVSFPAFAASNTTGASSVSGTITFTATSSGVSVAVGLTASAARKRHAVGITYTICTVPASAGCGAVGAIAPGGDLSAQGGVAFPPTSFTFISTAISLTSIAGDSVVLAYTTGEVIGCANIAPIAAPPTTSVTVNVNVNVNVAVTISNSCPWCPAITTAYWSGVYIPYQCTTIYYGIPYVCAGAGYINVLVPCTLTGGQTTTVYTCPTSTVTISKKTTTLTSSCNCATPSTTVVTVPVTTSFPTSTVTVTPTAAAAACTTCAAVTTAAAAATTGVSAASCTTCGTVVSQIAAGAAVQNKAVGALAALAAVAAFF